VLAGRTAAARVLLLFAASLVRPRPRTNAFLIFRLAFRMPRAGERTAHPYEFQDLVAELLRGMSYHVPHVAAPGPDGGHFLAPDEEDSA
jgi:hypothetical protein